MITILPTVEIKEPIILKSVVDHLTYISRDKTTEFHAMKNDKIKIDYETFYEMYTMQRKFFQVPWVIVLDPPELFHICPELEQIRCSYEKAIDCLERIPKISYIELGVRLQRLSDCEKSMIFRDVQIMVDNCVVRNLDTLFLLKKYFNIVLENDRCAICPNPDGR